ncbi:MAG: dnaN [Acidobacteria bacterium]|jgi:DNA polymerase-3 subunit beta|nr:dnaN [Acidobacteriota bacterium]
MELVVRKADLLRELQLLQGIVERKITKPVLGNVLVEAGENELRLFATDLDVGMRSRCDASVSRPGSVTIPAKKLFEIVRALPETDVRIEEDQNAVRVAADRFDSRMATEPVEEYPLFPTEGDEGPDELAAAGLRQMVAKTHFAVTGEDTRYFLNGALLVLKRDAMSLVATDGHRLALITVPRSVEGKKKREAETGDEDRVILPKKTLAELGRLLADSDVDVAFSKGGNHLFFKVGDRVLVSRVIDGNFPAYDRVIPKGNDKRVEFERDRLTSAVRRVALLSNERSRAVTFQMDPGQVEVSSRSAEFGDAREVLMVEYDGPSLKICFNAQYVLDFLNAVETERVSLDFKDDVSQSLMRPVAPEGYDYLYVIMPMRL